MQTELLPEKIARVEMTDVCRGMLLTLNLYCKHSHRFLKTTGALVGQAEVQEKEQ